MKRCSPQGDGILRQRDNIQDAFLGQKIEWGISAKLQISTFVHVLQSTNQTGSDYNGNGRLGSRDPLHAWATVGSPFTHVAGRVRHGKDFLSNPAKRLGEAAYTVSPSVLLSHEFSKGKYQLLHNRWSCELVVAFTRTVEESEMPHHSIIYSNSGISMHVGHENWAVGEPYR